MTIRPRNPTDLLTGLLFTGLGLAFVFIAGDYRLGTAQQMGPAYFPTVVGGLLALLGVILALKSQLGAEGALESFAWRPLAIVVVSIVLFGLTVRGAGFVPAILILTVVSLSASDRFGVVTAVVLAAALAAFSWAVFTLGLGLPLPAFGSWFPR
jgi:hypothetical protein